MCDFPPLAKQATPLITFALATRAAPLALFSFACLRSPAHSHNLTLKRRLNRFLSGMGALLLILRLSLYSANYAVALGDFILCQPLHHSTLPLCLPAYTPLSSFRLPPPRMAPHTRGYYHCSAVCILTAKKKKKDAGTVCEHAAFFSFVCRALHCRALHCAYLAYRRRLMPQFGAGLTLLLRLLQRPNNLFLLSLTCRAV